MPLDWLKYPRDAAKAARDGACPCGVPITGWLGGE